MSELNLFSFDYTPKPKEPEDLTAPGPCCDDYREYLAEMGAVEPGRLLRVGKHLVADGYKTVALVYTRKRVDKQWVSGFKAMRFNVSFRNLEDIEYLQFHLSKPKELSTASVADVSSATRLPTQCAADFCDVVREVQAYRRLSGECAYCNAMIGPDLLLAAGMHAELEAATQRRKAHLEWKRSHNHHAEMNGVLVDRQRRDYGIATSGEAA